MAQAYWAERISGTAVSRYSSCSSAWQVLSWPPGWPMVEFLEAFRFDEQDLRYLRGLGQFPTSSWWLAGVRFTGDVWARRKEP